MCSQVSREEEGEEEDAQIPEVEIDQPVVENVILHFNTQDNGLLDTKPIIEHVGENAIPAGIATFQHQVDSQEEVKNEEEITQEDIKEEDVMEEEIAQADNVPGTSIDVNYTGSVQVEEEIEYKLELALSDVDDSNVKEDLEVIVVTKETRMKSNEKEMTRKSGTKAKGQVKKSKRKESEEVAIDQEESTTVHDKTTSFMPYQAYGLFRNIHACVKQLHSLHNYTWLCEIDEAKGKGEWDEMYYNYKQGKYFMKCVAKRVRTNIAKELKKASYFSVIVDNDKNKTGHEQFSIRVRVVKRAVIQEFFVSLETIENCSDTTEMWSAIWKGLQNVGVTRQMMCRMSSLSIDGTCVEDDNHYAIVEHAQKMNSCLIGIHCTNHRLEQSLWNAGKQLPLFTKVYILLHGLYDFYMGSTRQRLLLQGAAERVDVDFIPPAQVSCGSWIRSWIKALRVVQEGHAAFSKQLSEVPSQQGKVLHIFFYFLFK